MKKTCRYFFLKDPSKEQISQVTQLYRKAGWWTDVNDNPALVKGMISGCHIFRIAVMGNTIIGMGRAISDGISDAYIQDVTVAVAYRGRGIGATIVKDLVLQLEKDGLTWIGLIAVGGTQALYRPFGFKMMRNATPMLRMKNEF